ncbi:MAG: hypothetical protein ACKOOG_05480, partial [Actinomycetota bacterium]
MAHAAIVEHPVEEAVRRGQNPAPDGRIHTDPLPADAFALTGAREDAPRSDTTSTPETPEPEVDDTGAPEPTGGTGAGRPV